MRKAPNKIELTQNQIDYIKANFFKKTNKELANDLGLRLTTLRTRCYAMGLKRMELEYWTKEQITYLKKYYRRIGDTELASIFNKKWHKNKGWDKKHIEKKRRYLGLKRTPAERKAIKQRNIKKGMFKMCTVKGWKTRGTAAKEGDVKVWLVRGVPHKFIKINNRFIKLARYNWEKYHNKKVRKGYCITFKDNDTMNCEPENLLRITQKQNALRNSQGFYSLPKDLQKAIKTVNLINKQLNNEK